jgi:CRISPR/Cas system CSM-associated protein Csm2 small subunit
MNSLSGSSRTTLLGCLSPNLENHDESLRTLQFVKRCKKLKTSPIQSLIKEKAGVRDQEMTNRVQSLEAENLKLKAELAKYQGEREKPEPQVFYDYTVCF